MPRTKKKNLVLDLVERFADWAPGDADVEDLGNLDLFLSVRRDYLDADPCTWLEGDVETLLLEVFPRKVQSDPSLLGSGPAVLGRFLRWLDSTGRLRGSGIHQVEAELAEVAPHFAAAMNDSSRFGMAKTLFAGVSLDDIDLPLPAVTEPLVLPPVTLADETELRRLAAAAPLVARVGALLSYVGPQGRPVTQTGALRVADAKELAPTLGDDDRLQRPTHWQRPVRRMADLSGVSEAYELAVAAGLLDVSGSKVRRDLSRPGATDVLARTAELATSALSLGVFLGETPPLMAWLVDAVDAALPGILGLLYAAGEPVPLDMVAGDLAHELGIADDDRTPTVRAYLERAVERYGRLGVVDRLGVHVPAERQWLGAEGAQATSVALTPLGVWWLQHVLPEFGVRTPLIGELASATARELCAALPGHSEQSGRAEIAAWTAARGPEEAARQLAALLADTDVACRQVAVMLLDELPGAAVAVRPLLDDPAARAYARFWLESHGEQVDERYREPGDGLLLFVETAGLLVASGGAEELLGQLTGMQAPVEFVRQLWRVESAYTEVVLGTIAAGAAPVLRKAARKALFSLRSSGR